ncbi:fungal-specific transcription factor domain-containing protein [Phellopilus nigrolimitatus]|nr:fungal-specific transcription factor domain-containing protein [Phellopilus nigrolimitatus]
MLDKDPSSPMAQPPKKKRVQDQPLSPDAGQKPIQLQRRRVWRACESCRKKKVKCDGMEPVCSQCSATNTACTWLQTKDRAALSRHYVQELEARLMHMEEVFKQVKPIVEVIEKSPNGGQVPIQGIVDALQNQNSGSQPPILQASSHKRASSELSSSPSPKSPSVRSSANDDDMSESFGQLALDEHGHLRWIGGSSTMSLIQSFRALTTSPLHRISPMEDDPYSPGPSANKLYFPASVFFGRIHALPEAEEVEYPDRDLADTMVNAYFSRLHFLLPVIDKPSFIIAYNHLMEHKDEVLFVRAQTPFIALVFAVFACAARIVDDPRLHDNDEGGLGMVYYERALILQYISHASIQITHVQCFVLLSSFLCAVNCLPQAWLLVGQAVRMSQDLGLHRYSRHISIKPIEKQVRRKVFWCVYSLDRMLAMALGRPIGIEDTDCDADYPVEFDDDELPEFFSGAPMQRSQPSLMVGFIALVDLYKIAGRVCRQIYGIDRFRDHLEPEKVQELVEQATQLDGELVEWCNQLPSTFKSSPTNEAQVTMGAVLCSHYYSILTTLHRNFLPITQSHYTGLASSLKAVHTARSCIRLAPSVKNVVPSSHHLAFFIQHLFSSAVIILLYAMHISDKEAARAAMIEAESCMGVVSAWDGVWPGARKCRELLSELASTAWDAIRRGTPSAMNSPQGSSPFNSAVSPSSPTRTHLQRSLSGRMIKPKPARGKSRDSRERDRRRSVSVQRSRSSAPGPSGLARRAISQKRPHDEMEQPEASGSASPAGRAFHQSLSSGLNMNRQESPQRGLVERKSERQVSFMPTSPVFGPSLPPANDPDSMKLLYNIPDPSVNWSAAGPSSNNRDMFRNVSQDSDNSSGYSYNALSQNMMDPAGLMAYGSALESMIGGVQQQQQTQEDSPPSSSFATNGLPFAGLDFIRNYTPGVYDDGPGQDGLWQGFDGGEFRYDPDLQFSLGEFSMDGSD